ncbi:hypothetical protein BN9982_510026 [Mycobacterium tuberculosis]|nr:hypothetical protein BN9982_510026 [Mycobacterium tuberculosis]
MAALALIFLKARCQMVRHVGMSSRIPSLVSIGYEGRTVDELVRQLIDNEVLVDVSEILIEYRTPALRRCAPVAGRRDPRHQRIAGHR